MMGDHHGRTAGRATLLVRAIDEILGTHNGYPQDMNTIWRKFGAVLMREHPDWPKKPRPETRR
jgi:hypothetical protein